MKVFALGIAVLALVTTPLLAGNLGAQPTALRNVTVVDVAAGSHLRDRTVLIDGGRIAALGDSGSIALPRGTRIIDGRGKYLIPGMWDMHVHLSMGGRSALQLLVANGVLGVRDMGDAFDRVEAWRDSIASGSVLGPRIEMVGPIIENAQWLTRVVTMLNQQGQTDAALALGERIGVSTPDEARAAVDRLAGMGVTMIKVRNAPPTPAYYELLRAARSRGLRVTGHPAERSASLADASDSGQASIEHLILNVRQQGWVSTLDAMSAAERSALFARLARNRTAFVPTIIAGVGFRRMPDSVVLALINDSTSNRDPRRQYLASTLARTWRQQMDMKRLEGAQPDWETLHRQAAAHLRAMDSSGVLVLTGTDLGSPLIYPGFGLHDELARLVQEGGMAPGRALRAATLGPAQFLGLDRDRGIVAPGMRADLVLLNADPLADIANVGRIEAVIQNGRLLDRAALDRILTAVVRSK